MIRPHLIGPHDGEGVSASVFAPVPCWHQEIDSKAGFEPAGDRDTITKRAAVGVRPRGAFAIEPGTVRRSKAATIVECDCTIKFKWMDVADLSWTTRRAESSHSFARRGRGT
jgi:hypothetical protein